MQSNNVVGAMDVESTGAIHDRADDLTPTDDEMPPRILVMGKSL